jgi:RNA polymerase sigma-70 factor, ECF subfamily
MSPLSKTDFTRLIQEYQGIVNSLCSIYFASAEDRKDGRQDIILQLWRAYPTFRNEAKVSTWIYKVALNTILAKNRKAKRRICTESLSSYTLDSTATSAFANDDVQHLQQAISMLQDLDKAIVILHLEGYSHSEIAANLSLTETNISTRFSRIKLQLQRIFKSKQYESR